MKMERQLQKEFEFVACNQISSKNIEIELNVANDTTAIGGSAHGHVRQQSDERSGKEIIIISSDDEEQHKLPHHPILPSEQSMQLESSPSPPMEQNLEVPLPPRVLHRPWLPLEPSVSVAPQRNQQNHSEVSNTADIALHKRQMEQVLPLPRTSDTGENSVRSEAASRMGENEVQSIPKSNKVSVKNAPDRVSYNDSVAQLIDPRKRFFRCTVCHKLYLTKQYLTVHKWIHTAEKPTCDICKKSFASKTYLMDHKNIHTGARPYKCNVCNKTYPMKIYLFKHRKRHEKGGL